MPFIARLLLSFSCIVAATIPVAAGGMVAVADGPALHCQHEDPVNPGDLDAGALTEVPGGCEDCGVCASQCMPVLVGPLARLPSGWSSVQVGAPSPRLAGITAALEPRPPRF